jgi:hypothetical protein
MTSNFAYSRVRELWKISRNFRLLVGVTAGMLLVRALVYSPPEKPLRSAVPMDRISVAPPGRVFDALTENNKTFVKESYKKLLMAHEQKDYSSMLNQARNVLIYVDEYNDTRSYERIAQRGLNQLEEERRRRETEEKIRIAREEVGHLQVEASIQFQQALADPAMRPGFESLIARIFILDPSNRAASEWIRALHEFAAGERRQHSTRELASLEIKGEGLVSKAKKDAESRAQLYEISDRIRQIDPANTYPGEWRQKIHHAP